MGGGGRSDGAGTARGGGTSRCLGTAAGEWRAPLEPFPGRFSFISQPNGPGGGTPISRVGRVRRDARTQVFAPRGRLLLSPRSPPRAADSPRGVSAVAGPCVASSLTQVCAWLPGIGRSGCQKAGLRAHRDYLSFVLNALISKVRWCELNVHSVSVKFYFQNISAFRITEHYKPLPISLLLKRRDWSRFIEFPPA